MKLIIAISICLMVSYRAYSDESELFGAKKFSPLREHSIVVTREGYFPQSISLFEGETLRVFLTSTDNKKGCLMLPSHDLFLAANKGRLTSGEVKFDEPGTYQFFCPNHNIKGSIVVLKKKNKKELKRVPAQVTNNVWMPKEY